MIKEKTCGVDYKKRNISNFSFGDTVIDSTSNNLGVIKEIEYQDEPFITIAWADGITTQNYIGELDLTLIKPFDIPQIKCKIVSAKKDLFKGCSLINVLTELKEEYPDWEPVEVINAKKEIMVKIVRTGS